MKTSARATLIAFDRAKERLLDKLLDTRQLEGSEAKERGAGCEDPQLLGQVLNGILAGLQTMQPTLYRQTADACTDQASTAACIQQLMCDDPMSPSYYIMGWPCVKCSDQCTAYVAATKVMPATSHTVTSV